jgi:hypothetical protein
MAKGKILGHCVEMWDTFNGILDQGVSMSTAFAIQSGYGQASSGSLLSQFHEIFSVSITQLLAGSYAQ